MSLSSSLDRDSYLNAPVLRESDFSAEAVHIDNDSYKKKSRSRGSSTERRMIQDNISQSNVNFGAKKINDIDDNGGDGDFTVEEKENMRLILSGGNSSAAINPFYSSTIVGDEKKPKVDETMNKSWKFFLLKCCTIFLLFIGYTGMYLAFSILQLTSNTIIKQEEQFDENTFGLILSISRGVRIIPKFFAGTFSDLFGGKLMFVLGQFLSGVMTIAFALPIFNTAVWYLAVCYTLQQIATVYPWPALIKISSHWTHYKHTGIVIGFLSLSYLFGDAISRAYLSLFLYIVPNWRYIFYIGGGTLTIMSIVSFFLLQSSPKIFGYVEPPADPTNVLGDKADQEFTREHSHSGLIGYLLDIFQRLKETFLPMITSAPFYFIILWYCSLTWIRYFFYDWSAVYLSQHVHISDANASMASVLFPLFGGIASLFMGFLNDRLSVLNRNIVMLFFEIVLLLLLVILWLVHNYVPFGSAAPPNYQWLFEIIPMVLFCLIGFTTIGPFSLSGTMSVRFGGKKIASTMSSTMDGFATLVSMFSGFVGGRILKDKTPQGWSIMFLILILVSILCILITFCYIVVDNWDKKRRERRKADASGDSH